MLCRLKGVQEVAQNTTSSLHSVMREYLLVSSPVSPTLTHNARILDGSQQLLSQVTGVDYHFS